jgi:hypothetical protein
MAISTLSPGTIRMKFFRIFPLICARTRSPLGNNTRNIVFGSTSQIVPCVTSDSSFAMPEDVRIPQIFKCQVTRMCQFRILRLKAALALLRLVDQPTKLIKKIGRIMRPGRSLRVILDAEHRKIAVSHSFDRPVI